VQIDVRAAQNDVVNGKPGFYQFVANDFDAPLAYHVFD
jgi:hypothetical protein